MTCTVGGLVTLVKCDLLLVAAARRRHGGQQQNARLRRPDGTIGIIDQGLDASKTSR